MDNDNIEDQRPLTRDIYCYTVLAEHEGVKKYHTVLFGPLLKKWIAPVPNTLESTLGVHRFTTSNDQPMYLIPYDDKVAERYGKMVNFELHPQNPDELDRMLVPMEFELGIAAHFEYKLQGGLLYKRVKDGWLIEDTNTE